jgi:uncharacterized protein YbaR (Trm112 family)
MLRRMILDELCCPCCRQTHSYARDDHALIDHLQRSA